MPTYSHILAAVDLDDAAGAKAVCEAALGMQSLGGGQLHVMTVVPDFGMSIVGSFFPADHEKQAMASAQQALHALTAENLPAAQQVQHVIRHGTVYKEILAAAALVQADIIVVGSHRPDTGDYLLGPNAARVARHASCSVLVVRCGD